MANTTCDHSQRSTQRKTQQLVHRMQSLESGIQRHTPTWLRRAVLRSSISAQAISVSQKKMNFFYSERKKGLYTIITYKEFSNDFLRLASGFKRMYRRVVVLALAGSAAAFMPSAPLGSTAPGIKATSGTPAGPIARFTH